MVSLEKANDLEKGDEPHCHDDDDDESSEETSFLSSKVFWVLIVGVILLGGGLLFFICRKRSSVKKTDGPDVGGTPLPDLRPHELVAKLDHVNLPYPEFLAPLAPTGNPQAVPSQIVSEEEEGYLSSWWRCIWGGEPPVSNDYVRPLIHESESDGGVSQTFTNRLNNIPTSIGNVCWLAAFLEVLGQAQVSAWIEKHYYKNDVYIDLTVPASLSGEKRTDKITQNARTRQIRELLRLSSDFVLGRCAPENNTRRPNVYYNKRPSIDNVVRTFAKEVNTAIKHLTVGGQNDADEGVSKIIEWLQVDALFGLDDVSSVTCQTCKNVSSRRERQTKLYLPMLGDHTTLDASYNNRSQTEQMSGDNKYQCDKCNAKRDAEKQLLVHDIRKGQVLMFSMKRYNNKQKKLREELNFPLTFSQSFDGGKTTVQATLVSTLEHGGETGGGHYISRAKTRNPDGSLHGWHYFTNGNSSPTKLSDAEVLNAPKKAYVLFYVVNSVTTPGSPVASRLNKNQGA